MRRTRAVVTLSLLIAALALAATLTGLFARGGEGPRGFTTLRGESARIDGRGLYLHDTLFAGAGFRGQDAVTLLAGIPLLVLTALLHRRGSLRGGLLLTGVLAWFLYAYLSLAFSAAYNGLFLLYTALFSASLFALLLAFQSLDPRAFSPEVLARLPRRFPGILLLAGGGVTSVVWLGPLVEALLEGRPPALLGPYTTMVTSALDLAVITPSTVLAGVWILRRNPLGYRLAFPLLGIVVMLLPVIAVSTAWQAAAGVAFTPGEIAGPISGFLVIGALSVRALAGILRRLPPRTVPAPPLSRP